MREFGSLFKQLRAKTGLTLRKYCEQFELDAIQISRIERGLLPPPKDRVRLEFYAKSLGLKEGSEDWNTFFDLALASNKSFEDKIRRPALLEKLPIFLKSIYNGKLDDEKLDKLLELIRKS